MKKVIPFLFFFCFEPALLAQSDPLYPVSASGFSQGFVNIVSGQQLDHPPVLQKGKRALQVVSGGQAIVFESAPLPEGKEDQITFVWEASLSKSVDGQGGKFEFYIHDKKYLTFSRPENGIENNWTVQQGSVSLSFVATGLSDEKGSILGYQFLNVSRSEFPTGKPLVLKITAENSGLTDVYTAYQNEVGSSMHAFSLQAVKRKAGLLKQPILIEYTHVGAPDTAAIYLNEEKQFDQAVRLGLNRMYIWLDTVSKPSLATVKLVLENNPKTEWKQSFLLKPVHPFDVYFLPHSHVDIGFTHLQAEVEKLQWRNIEQGIELAKKTADYPESARYKWNVEVLWAVDGYLKNAAPETRNAFFDAVKKGWIGLDALYGSELTGLQRPEELMRITSFANQLEREQGIKIQSAMITDVPGYAWGIVPALAENEVKYFSVGPNHMPHKAHGGYQVGHTFEAWGDVPFYWEAPSGKNKVLFWMTRHGYSWFHDWLLGKMRYTGGTPILKFLGELDGENYPYDMVQIRYTLGDNGGPDADMPEFVREWNAEYEYPTFRIATTAEMFRDFEQKYASKLPIHRGDFTPYWEDGAASSALETGINRQSAEQLVQAETLWAMMGKEKDCPKADFDEAWTNVLLFSEHTWGAFSSKSDPDIDFSLDQWKVKKGFADNAKRQTSTLIDRALGALKKTEAPVRSLLVFNTTSWERTELVKIPADWQAAGLSVLNEKGKGMLTQDLSTGELAFLAENIPPFSAIRFNLKRSPRSSRKSAVQVENFTLHNEWLRVQIDPKTGAISSIRHKDQPFNLVDSSDSFGFNEYWYTGADAANPQRSSNPVISVVENGPLVASILIESEAPGAHHLSRSIQLSAGVNRVDIVNFVDKKKVLADENVRFSFPFNVPDGQVKIDLAWALMQPEKGQLKGANKNFFCAQHFVDISNRSDGVTWANLDAPLVETGEMQGQRWMSNLSTEPWLHTWQPSERLFSWVMNNVWFVNYKGYQDDPVSFRYSIRPHKAFESGAAKKFGIGLTQPLVVVPVGDEQKGIASLLTLKEAEGVVATSLKPARDGDAWMLRLFNASDRPARTRLAWGAKKPQKIVRSNQKEKDFEPVIGTIELGAWEILTLKVKF